MKRSTLLLLVTTLLVLVGLTACERPAPDSQPPPATATIGAPPIGATLLPPVAASPTPLGAPIDPNAPIGASPTPDPAATADPAAPPAEATAVPPAPTAAPTQQTTSSGEIIHIVAAGENLYRIGLRYGFTYQELAAYNSLSNPDALTIGQQIRIPPAP